MNRFLLVCFGGGLGSGARYAAALLGARWNATAFPYATLAVNIVGAFLISVVMGLTLRGEAISSEAKLFFATGILGGFTTFSSFSFETVTLAQRGQWAAAALYVTLSLLCGLGATALGMVLMR
ncbi:MAG: fluoride efflux transporter CrcB [Myxococcaceae bacterium]|nr:fluoride efflux transporter CrcB [Myxococcaceae bacterium]